MDAGADGESTAAPRPARWWILRGEEPVGPMGLEEARRRVLDGGVTPRTYVWADGMPHWSPARDVPALTPPPSVRSRLTSWTA